MIEWVPAASLLVLKMATPEPLRGAVPMTVEPSRKLTVPDGVPTLELTVATKVTV